MSDGTPEGTVRLGDAPALIPGSGLVTAGARLFFVRWASLIESADLWMSDGTLAGTRPVPGAASLKPGRLQGVDGIVYFRALDGSGIAIWRTDGTAAGTWRVARFARAEAISFFEWRLEKVGRRLMFQADDEGKGFRWWTTEGRPASTHPLGGCPGGCPTIVPAVGPQGGPVILDGKVFFRGSAPGNHQALWVTDGTAAGTRIVQDLCRGDACRSELLAMAPFVDKLLFTVRDDEAPLWRQESRSLSCGPPRPPGAARRARRGCA